MIAFITFIAFLLCIAIARVMWRAFCEEWSPRTYPSVSSELTQVERERNMAIVRLGDLMSSPEITPIPGGLDDLIQQRRAQAWKIWSTPFPSGQECEELVKQGKFDQAAYDRSWFQHKCRQHFYTTGSTPTMADETRFWNEIETEKLELHKARTALDEAPTLELRMERTPWGVEWK